MNLLEWDYKLLNHCNSGEGFSTISQICLYWQMVIPCSLKKKIKKIQLLISNPNSPFSHFEKLPYGKVFSNFLNYGIVFFRRENIHPWIRWKLRQHTLVNVAHFCIKLSMTFVETFISFLVWHFKLKRFPATCTMHNSCLALFVKIFSIIMFNQFWMA